MRNPWSRILVTSGLALAMTAAPAVAQTGAPARAVANAGAAKKPLDHDVYDIWNRINGQALADDGRWMLYGVTSEQNDPRLYVKQTRGNTVHEIERASGGRFSEDGRWVVFSIAPAKAVVEQMEKDDVPSNRMPRDSMGILDLSNGQITRVADVRNFAMPAEASGWLAYSKFAPPAADDSASEGRAGRAGGGRAGAAGAGRGGRGGGAGGGGAQPGTDLVLRNLSTGAEQVIDSVSSYEFNEDGGRLVYIKRTRGERTGDGIFVLEPATGTTRTLLSGKGTYQNVSFDDAGRQLAFLSNRDEVEADQPAFKLYLWDGESESAREVAAEGAPGIPAGWWVSEDESPSFSDTGRRLFFATRPRPEPETPDSLLPPEDERVTVDIWAWTDPLLQPNQLQQLNQERSRDYQAVIHLDQGGRIVQLATQDVPTLTLVRTGDADIALARSNLPYRQQVSWGESGNDYYFVDLSTGAREMLFEYQTENVSISPEGKYATWFDGEKKAWFAMDLATREIRDVSSAIPHPVHNELHDTPSPPGSYGSAGWTENDARFLIHDAYDIWEVDPAGAAAPRSITEGVGRRERIEFRYIDLRPDERAIPTDEPILLSAFNTWTKADGFYRDRVSGSAPPVQLVVRDRDLGRPTKAEDADVFLITSETFAEFPDLYITDPDFKQFRRMSEANPQQAEYTWGTSELVDWRSGDGEILQGVLYKPEGFDESRQYPMMVYFYERLSDNLHNYVVPSPGGSSINISFYVSRGYLVFTPDIPYRDGYPGESAMKAVVPGVLELIDRGFVDPKRVGVQGHSWGGYQIAYMVTRTNIFAAAEAGAPVSNMTSAYGGIRWSSGLSRMMQYEHGQSRIGGTLWQAPMQYIENSPIFWADKVQTPVLMLHNDQDGAVPWEQGIEYFVALRRLQKPVWLFNYNGEEHGLRREANRKDWTIRMQQFFDHYLKDAPPPVWMVEGVPALLKGKTLGLELVKPKISSEEQDQNGTGAGGGAGAG